MAPPRPPAQDEPIEETLRRDPLIGAVLGDYVVEERIGLGGMGIVYRGAHRMIGKKVAIKVLRPELADDPDQLQRILLEARASARLKHRCIVDVHGFGVTPDGREYLVMELLEGEPLDQVLSAQGRLPLADVLSILEDVLGALSVAHEQGVVHRDLKPSNLILVREPDGSRHAKVLDFGLALAVGLDSAHGRLAGTPHYMSPEQVENQALDGRSDLYAVGVIAYQLLTGELPFDGPTGVEVAVKRLTASAPPLTDRRPDAPPLLAAVVARLLSRAPAARHQTADEVRRDLASLQRSLPRRVAEADAVRATGQGPSAEEIALAQQALHLGTRARQSTGIWILGVAGVALAGLLLLLAGPLFGPGSRVEPRPEGNARPGAMQRIGEDLSAAGPESARVALHWRADDLLDRARRLRVDPGPLADLQALRGRISGSDDAALASLERELGAWEQRFLAP